MIAAQNMDEDVAAEGMDDVVEEVQEFELQGEDEDEPPTTATANNTPVIEYETVEVTMSWTGPRLKEIAGELK